MMIYANFDSTTAIYAFMGWIPVGPDYSSHNAEQYATYFFRRSAISKFIIDVEGTYDGLWVKTLRNDFTFPDATEGWLDMFKLYTGAGVPGRVVA